MTMCNVCREQKATDLCGGCGHGVCGNCMMESVTYGGGPGFISGCGHSVCSNCMRDYEDGLICSDCHERRTEVGSKRFSNAR